MRVALKIITKKSKSRFYGWIRGKAIIRFL
jgi:hypothetical protein